MKLSGLSVSAALLLGTFGLVGCANEMSSEDGLSTAEQAITGGPSFVGDHPKMDASPVTFGNNQTFTAPTGTYTDLAASAWNLYLLRTDNGFIEQRSIAWPDGNPSTVATNFRYAAIDYVEDANNAWGLIGSLTDYPFIGIKIDPATGFGTWIPFPTGVSRVGELVGMASSGSTTVLDLYLRVSNYAGIGSFMHGTYDSTTGLASWDPTLHQGGFYSEGLTTKDGQLIEQMDYYFAGFIRYDPNNNYASAGEKLGLCGGATCTEHAYTYAYDKDRFAARAFDYDAAGGKFYAIDEYYNRNNGTSKQVLVQLAGSSVVF